MSEPNAPQVTPEGIAEQVWFNICQPYFEYRTAAGMAQLTPAGTGIRVFPIELQRYQVTADIAECAAKTIVALRRLALQGSESRVPNGRSSMSRLIFLCCVAAGLRSRARQPHLDVLYHLAQKASGETLVSPVLKPLGPIAREDLDLWIVRRSEGAEERRKLADGAFRRKAPLGLLGLQHAELNMAEVVRRIERLVGCEAAQSYPDR